VVIVNDHIVLYKAECMYRYYVEIVVNESCPHNVFLSQSQRQTQSGGTKKGRRIAVLRSKG
jgi:hypothetical protein